MTFFLCVCLCVHARCVTADVSLKSKAQHLLPFPPIPEPVLLQRRVRVRPQRRLHGEEPPAGVLLPAGLRRQPAVRLHHRAGRRLRRGQKQEVKGRLLKKIEAKRKQRSLIKEKEKERSG